MPLAIAHAAALVPVICLGAVFVLYTLVLLVRDEPMHMPRTAWAVLIIFTAPLGGILYLVVGREQRS